LELGLVLGGAKAMTTILVIEDEQAVRESLVDLLNAEQFTTIAAENGEVGLRLAQCMRPDLIVCDVQMPVMDGYGVLQALKQDPKTATIPFIYLSGRSNNEDFRYCMQLGADDYLQKPCDPDELISAIAARLVKRSALRQAAVTETYFSSSSYDGLLNYFYQELRNPLSNLNHVIYLLRNLTKPTATHPTVKSIQRDYGRELSVLQEVAKAPSLLVPECNRLLQDCHLDVVM
jgi:two-component system, OmpR family, alkaline phosphatase synthesis response regulator PhoP